MPNTVQQIEAQIQILETGDDFAKLGALGQLVILVNSLQNESDIHILIEACPEILKYLNHDDAQMLSNALALITALLQFSTGANAIFASIELIHVVIGIYNQYKQHDNVAINALSCLTEAVRNNESKSKALVQHSEFASILEKNGVSEPVLEAAADLMCSICQNHNVTDLGLNEEKVVGFINDLCKEVSYDIRGRALLALGMILPRRDHLHAIVAHDSMTIESLKGGVAQSDDIDVKILSATLMKLFSKSTAICATIAADLAIQLQ
uniref:Uncharacterized protein n=1 Tax=Polytomella parva TaxID=51329 RepID=A0A7S0VF92_9CHLO|mmetsp:Transcript_34665/g.62444  ORF Transcript_34665/g.62444 Transcript_34665/m.62444 type:complete len:266 (+) Transcript_34665:44-841(+)